ncbi:hypothetical protein M885DRAFT_496326 [Pelagophyceae sp. CCMP2097]|nr:hypothetical protein M885DRAFT_496326 [Pelagophyceae sp. CCMP2097]|eukprot:CAMPEP_0206811514 /NCGR_PEP_ID=MMETSP0975-20121206/7296_1 /ASSEMBLY_ACC=CAM_ASM_000399 /TAXON_ID=483370 /ORGANISM="non described non described, Strain CCMP2097" /LENGTH=249 /DNA_ID=CAMNT_0054353637 /DNA_START=30 /DNA_END=779 /DNA_ORIENTATION=+
MARDEGLVQATVSMLAKLARSSDQYSENGRTLRANLIDFAKTLSALGLDDEAKKVTMEALQKVMETSVGTQSKIKSFVGACGAVSADVSSRTIGLDSEDIPDFKAAFQSKMARQPKRPLSQNEDYAKLQKLARPFLGGAEDEDDDDDCMVDETQEDTEASFICPITQKIMDVPMKSKKCGHSYSKEAVEGYFKGGEGKKCAHPGCNQKLGSADFDRDFEKDAAIKRFKSREKAQQKATKASQKEDEDPM